MNLSKHVDPVISKRLSSSSATLLNSPDRGTVQKENNKKCSVLYLMLFYFYGCLQMEIIIWSCFPYISQIGRKKPQSKKAVNGWAAFSLRHFRTWLSDCVQQCWRRCFSGLFSNNSRSHPLIHPSANNLCYQHFFTSNQIAAAFHLHSGNSRLWLSDRICLNDSCW